MPLMVLDEFPKLLKIDNLSIRWNRTLFFPKAKLTAVRAT